MKNRVLETMRIDDFQGWKRGEITFGRVTILTGDSDTGKSAVLRALLCHCTADNGKGMARTGQKNWRTTLVVNGNAVSWDGKAYRLLMPNGDADKISREKAETITGLREIKVAKDISLMAHVNPPLAGPFMITEHGPTVARKLSVLLEGATVTLSALREAKRQERAQDKEKTGLARQKAEKRVQLDRYWNATEDLRNAQDLQKEVNEAQALAQKFKALQRVSETIKGGKERAQAAKKVADEATGFMKTAIETMRRIRTNYDELERLSRAANSIRGLRGKLDTAASDIIRRKEVVGIARQRLQDVLETGSPCPYSGVDLPEACVTSLTKKGDAS